MLTMPVQPCMLPVRSKPFSGICLPISMATHTAAMLAANWQRIPLNKFDTGTGYGRKEGNILFNDTLNTFYLRSYGIRHMVKDHSDSERGIPLPPHGLLFLIISKGSFICIIPQTG